MLNRAILMGRLTRDPELKQTPNNVSVATFSLAVDRNYQSDKDNKQTDFINIVAWRHTAEFVSKYFTKGQLVAVEGSIQTRSYQDKDGNNRTVFEVVADQVYFAEKKQNGNASEKQEEPQENFDVNDFEEFDAGDDDDFHIAILHPWN